MFFVVLYGIQSALQEANPPTDVVRSVRRSNAGSLSDVLMLTWRGWLFTLGCWWRGCAENLKLANGEDCQVPTPVEAGEHHSACQH